jgi:hypothetical protein
MLYPAHAPLYVLGPKRVHSLASLSRSVFFFNCHEINDIPKNATYDALVAASYDGWLDNAASVTIAPPPTSSSYLIVDYSLKCFDDKWWAMFPFALGVVIFFSFGVPFFLLGMLLQYRNALQEMCRLDELKEKEAAAAKKAKKKAAKAYKKLAMKKTLKSELKAERKAKLAAAEKKFKAKLAAAEKSKAARFKWKKELKLQKAAKHKENGSDPDCKHAPPLLRRDWRLDKGCSGAKKEADEEEKQIDAMVAGDEEHDEIASFDLDNALAGTNKDGPSTALTVTVDIASDEALFDDDDLKGPSQPPPTQPRTRGAGLSHMHSNPLLLAVTAAPQANDSSEDSEGKESAIARVRVQPMQFVLRDSFDSSDSSAPLEDDESDSDGSDSSELTGDSGDDEQREWSLRTAYGSSPASERWKKRSRRPTPQSAFDKEEEAKETTANIGMSPEAAAAVASDEPAHGDSMKQEVQLAVLQGLTKSYKPEAFFFDIVNVRLLLAFTPHTPAHSTVRGPSIALPPPHIHKTHTR